MFCFIRAKPFDSMAMFRRYIVVPFDQGDDDKAIDILIKLNDSLCLRRTREIIKLPDLNEIPPRRLDLSQEERVRYERTKATLQRKIRQKVGDHEQTSKFGIFQMQLQLRILCNHGTFQKHFSWMKSVLEAKEAMLSSGAGNAQVNCDGCSDPMAIQGSNKVYSEFADNCNHVLCLQCLEEATTAREPENSRRSCPLCKAHKAVAAGSLAVTRNRGENRGTSDEFDDSDYFDKNGHSTKMTELMKDVKQDLQTTKR